MRRVLLLAVSLLLVMTLPAGATTDWVGKGRAGSAGHPNTYGRTSVGYSQATIVKTVNRVDGVRLRYRTTDSTPADVDIYSSVECANGSAKQDERTIRTKADSGWTYITLYPSSDTKRGQCLIVGYIDDWYGERASPIEVQIQTTTY
jgi:hypothetical protein